MVDEASNKIRVALLALITTIVMILVATNGIGTFKEPALALSSSVNLVPSSSPSIHITKDTTLEYSIANGTVLIGAFDSSYSITGDAKSLRSSKNLIISTVEDDFIKSPSVGYVLVANNTSATTSSNSTAATGQKNIANPFASTDTIKQNIQNKITESIDSLSNSNSKVKFGNIHCDFGSSLHDWNCNVRSL
jgi:flagellin-like hook-associated protein FlgL